jgi:nucleoside phosphorylase
MEVRIVEGGRSVDAEKIDVFILTAIETEYTAVAHHLDPGRIRRTLDGATYEIGRFSGEHGRVTVGVQLAGPGNEMAAALCERAIALLRPAVVLLVGVAGGRKDAALGDVVVADTVYGYETGRDEENGFLPRIKSWPSSFALVQKARLIAADKRWQRRIVPPPEGTPTAHIGAVAAGAKVVAHARSASGRLLSDIASDTLAVEMEGLGLLTAARINPHVQALVVRGISDLLGDKDAAHDALWQPVAARHAAAFAFELISVSDTGRRSASLPGAEERARRRLSPRQLGTLAGLLLKVPGLTSPISWQQLLDSLPGIGVMTSRQPNQHLEAVSLLRTCEAYDGWARFMEALDSLWPGAPAVEDVHLYLVEHQLLEER